MKKLIMAFMVALMAIGVKAETKMIIQQKDRVEETSQTLSVDDKIVSVEAYEKVEFDLCNDAKALTFDWADFTKNILIEAFTDVEPEGISTMQFYDWFGADDTNPDFEGAADGDWAKASAGVDGGYSFDCDLFASASASAKANVNTYGRVKFYLNENGMTNCEFEWYLTAEEMEKITHDGNSGVVSTYIRWTGKAGSPYSYLWLKLTATVIRTDVDKYSLAQKNADYWYDYNTGNYKEDDSFSAVLLDVNSPDDGCKTSSWTQSQLDYWLINQVFLEKDGELVTSGTANVTTTTGNITVGSVDGQTTKSKTVSGAKFYFVPETFTVETPQGINATQYTITPCESNSNSDWNKLIPRYITHKLANNISYFTEHDNLNTTSDLPSCKLDATKHTWVSEENANNIINSCAIDYNAGCFNNNKLYAKYGSSYTLIATLDQQTGSLTLKHYTEGTDEYNVVSDVLNAVGYDNESENHHANNIAKELRARIGVIATTQCDLAAQMQDATWMNSWERPINVEINESSIYEKCKGFIYMSDILKLYDWRGPINGDMNGPDNVWEWAYYNIHRITVDCTPSKVKTNLHYDNDTWSTGDEQYMSDVNSSQRVFFADSLKNFTHTSEFDLCKFSYERNFNCGHPAAYHNVNNSSWSKCGVTNITFDYATRSYRLYDILHSAPYTYVSKSGNNQSDGTPIMIDHKADFGYIYFDNKLICNMRYWVKVPVTISYEWGDIKSEVLIHVYPLEDSAEKSIEYYMNVNYKDGTTTKLDISDIETVTWDSVEQHTDTGAVDIPVDTTLYETYSDEPAEDIYMNVNNKDGLTTKYDMSDVEDVTLDSVEQHTDSLVVLDSLTLYVTCSDEPVEAKSYGNKIYMTDLLKLYDWRGPVMGDICNEDNAWLWAYYNIHSITVDCTPSSVRTNLHYENENWFVGREQYLWGINISSNLLFADSIKNLVHTYEFNLHNYSYERNFNCGHPASYHNINNASWDKCGISNLDYNYATRSPRLYAIMHSDPYTYVDKSGNYDTDGNPILIDHKADFGYFCYDFVPDNVWKFYVIVPVRIDYDGGSINTEVKVWIRPTHEN